MELRHVRYFVAVAEELHFGRAAERLQMAQPPLSQQIQDLERELEVQLFTRTKRTVTLTAAGEAFLIEARLLLHQADYMISVARRAAKGEIGHLGMSFVGSACYKVLPEIVQNFRARYPEISLMLHQLTTSQQIEALQQKQVQVGILRPPFADTGLESLCIARERLILALPEHHRLARQQRIPLQEIIDEPFILFPSEQGLGFYHQILGLCLDAGFVPEVVQEAAEMQTIVSLVATGIGLSLVPDSLRHLQRTGVVYRDLVEASPLLEVRIVWRNDDSSPVLRSFLDSVHAYLRSRG